ncbi:putative FAD-linked oxidoreductase, partial [Lachnellula arida]
MFSLPSPCSALIAATYFLTVSATTVSSNTTAACTAISGSSIETLTLSNDFLNSEYINAKDHYWSAANADLSPACAVFPTSAGEVSSIVSTLLKYPDVKFATKSGGHNSNVGWSSVDGGVLIVMSNLGPNTTFNSADSTANIPPGARWDTVIGALEPYSVAVVSGRLGDVGVAGLTLGGGLSFLSGQYGLVCDNVVNYEVVLANASIVNANASCNSDLFFALKGGGNQFGIITSFTMKTYPIGTNGQVWGGVRTYSGTYAEQIINATQNFTENYFQHPKAAVIVTSEIAIDSLLDIFVVFFFYDGETPPAGIFDAFDALPTVTDAAKTQTYSDLLNADDTTNIYGLRYLIRGTTIPNLPAPTGKTLFLNHYNSWKSYVLSNNALHPSFIFSLAFQPMPAIIPAHSAAAGGNALGMDARNGDFMWMEYDISWLTELGDDE